MKGRRHCERSEAIQPSRQAAEAALYSRRAPCNYGPRFAAVI